MHPVVFELAGLEVRAYGLALAIAFVVGIRVAMLRGRHQGLDPERILELGLVVLVASMLGARLLYVASFPEQFRPPLGSVRDVFLPSRSRGLVGMSMLGGVVLAALSALAFLRWRGMPVLRTMDVGAPSVLLGESITRIGCFFNGCCHGTTCALPWAVSFPQGSPAFAELGAALVHPTQLYTALGTFASFWLLLWLARRTRVEGAVLCGMLILIGLVRFAVDAVRHYPEAEIAFQLGGAPVPVHQLIGLGLAMAGAAGWWVASRRAAGAAP